MFRDIALGFTGTKHGMSTTQWNGVRQYVETYQHRIIAAHHGDCIGADKDFHDICMEFNIPIEQHPPTNNKYRAFCVGGEIHYPKDYGKRDKDIVNACNVLLATPWTTAEQLRSGTWMTIRMARKAVHHPAVIIFARDSELTRQFRRAHAR